MKIQNEDILRKYLKDYYKKEMSLNDDYILQLKE